MEGRLLGDVHQTSQKAPPPADPPGAEGDENTRGKLLHASVVGCRAEPAAWSQLELEGTMVGLVYNRTHGWRVHKRPYLDDFLDYLALSGLYELVVFANGYQFSIEPVLDKIDPLVLTSRGLQMRFAHRLARCAAARVPSASAAAGISVRRAGRTPGRLGNLGLAGTGRSLSTR